MSTDGFDCQQDYRAPPHLIRSKLWLQLQIPYTPESVAFPSMRRLLSNDYKIMMAFWHFTNSREQRYWNYVQESITLCQRGCQSCLSLPFLPSDPSLNTRHLGLSPHAARNNIPRDPTSSLHPTPRFTLLFLLSPRDRCSLPSVAWYHSTVTPVKRRYYW